MIGIFYAALFVWQMRLYIGLFSFCHGTIHAVRDTELVFELPYLFIV